MKQETIGWQRHQLDTSKLFAPRSSQITMPEYHHSISYRLDAFPDAQTNSVKALKANVK